ncbi:uncharacterized protein [Musca autumnalis]|uniref:uncharacterized protein n=1 Tax=Musca autumnalis TaxID=221902 RepID=UPI003CE7BCC8
MRRRHSEKAIVCILFLIYAISAVPKATSYVSHRKPNNTYATGYRPANNSYSNNNSWLTPGYKPANNSYGHNQWTRQVYRPSNNSYPNPNQWNQSGYAPVNNQWNQTGYKPANNLAPYNNWNQTAYRPYNNTRYHRAVPGYRPPQSQVYGQNGNNYSNYYHQPSSAPNYNPAVGYNNNPSKYYPSPQSAGGHTKNSTYFQPSAPTNHVTNSHIYPSLPNNGANRPQQPNQSSWTPSNGQTQHLYPQLPNSYANTTQTPVQPPQGPQGPAVNSRPPVPPNVGNNPTTMSQGSQNWNSPGGLAALSYSQVPHNQPNTPNTNMGYMGNQRKY